MQYLPCSLRECTDEVLQQSARLPRLRRGEGYYDMWGGHVPAEELRRKALEQEDLWAGETSGESSDESDDEVDRRLSVASVDSTEARNVFNAKKDHRFRRKERWSQSESLQKPNAQMEADGAAWMAGRPKRQSRSRRPSESSSRPSSSGHSRPSSRGSRPPSRASRPASRPQSRGRGEAAPLSDNALLPSLDSGGQHGSRRGSLRPNTVDFVKKYKGVHARADFFKMYHSMNNSDKGRTDHTEPGGNQKQRGSARHSFLQVCDRFGLAPRPLLLIPDARNAKDARSLNAKDRGIGPRFAEAIAASLESGYLIRHINLADNRIGLEGCRLLANALGRGNLVSLDLSGNHLGPQSSKPLIHVLKSNPCLNWLNVGGNELGNACVREIVQAATNTALPLVHLNLSKNNVSSVGAVAIGKLLPKMRLKLLDLSWNGINGRGAQTLISAITKAIQSNVLEEVHLGWNAVGSCSAIEGLARSLEKNKSMQTLDLKSNNIHEKTAVIFAESLFSNKTLSKLILDDNPLGRLGICALMATPSKVFLSIENCTFQEQGSFNPESPNGYYRLDLSKAYDRAIAGSLQRLAAADEGGENWKNEKLNGVPFNFPEDEPDEWEMPDKGILEVTYVATPKAVDAAEKKHNSRIASDETCQRLARFIDKQPNDGAKAEVIHTACAYFFFNALQLEALTSRILARQLKLDAVVSGWMRTVESTAHLRKWAEGWLTVAEQEALAEKLGPLLFFETEMPSGHYVLDLADPRGSHIAGNLQRMGNAERQRRKKRVLADTSSAHNYGPWRNCHHSLSTISSVSQWDIPTRGVFRLDYFSATRPPNFSQPIAAHAFVELKTNLSRALKEVSGKSNFAGAFWGALKQCTSGKAKWAQTKASVMSKIRAERRGSSLFEVAQLLKAVGQSRAAQDTAYNMMKCIVSSQKIHFSSDQAVELVGLFPAGISDVFNESEEGASNNVKKLRPKKEGKSRICAAVALTSQVIDGSFLTKLREIFTPEEISEFIHRVGWLNVWNPLEPAGDYVLDLGKHETREVARMLTALEYAGAAPKRAPLWRAHGDEHIVPDAKCFQNTKLNGQFFDVPYAWHSEGLPNFGRLTCTFTPVGPFPKEIATQLLKSSCLLGEHCEGWL